MHRLGPFAGLQHEVERDSDNLFVVRGSRLLVTEDADAHAAVEQCLVPWLGDEGNLMDRYDARMLLDNLSSSDSSVRHESNWSAEADSGATAEDADLDPSKEHLLATSEFPLHSGNEADLAGVLPHSPETAAHRHQGPAFALDYGSTSGQPVTTTAAAAGPRPRPPPLLPFTEDSPPATSVAEQAVLYLPPYERIPEHLAHHLPHSERQHQIIAQTARFVRSNGNQVEVLLRVKHGANPNFAFLMTHDRLFPYYRWLVEQAPQELAAQQQTLVSQQQQQDNVVVGVQQPEQGQQQGQQQEVDQPSSSQAAAPAAATAAAREAGDAAGDVGALELLRAYSMNSEADSDVGGRCGQQQQQPEAAEQTVEAFLHEDSQIVFGPALPPGFSPATDAAAAGDVSAASPAQQGPQQASPHGCPAQQQQQQQPSPGSPDSDSSGGHPVGPVTQGPADPPDTVRAIIDKLVAFVKKNGIKFERVVRFREQSTPRFAFLHPDSIHHGYYRRQLEEAVGPSPVRELFNNIKQQAQQAPEGTAQGPHLESEAAGPGTAAATVVTSAVAGATACAAATNKVVLKANPRLVPKRPLAPPATAPVEVVVTDEKAGSPEPATSSGDHQATVVAGDSTAPDTEHQHGPSATTAEQSRDPAAAVQQQDAKQQQQQPEEAPSDEPTATAGTVAVDAGHVISSAETQAQKRLRLRTYLRQRRAEQLAKEQQQEHDVKARAILSHRQLLKRAAAGADESDCSSAGGGGRQPGQQEQQQEVEEGEIPEEHDPPPPSASMFLTADAAARAEAMRLLQRSPEPVDTTLPGLKELASSAAAAAAKHRAALMVNSDDEKAADDGPADKQRQMLAAALKAAHEAAAAAGVGAAAGTPAAAAQFGTSVPAAQPVGAIVNMAAAANAAAAVIAAQAAGVPATVVQPQLVMPPLLQQCDTAAALTAAASAAATAAAAAVSKEQVDSAAANGHPASTSRSTQPSSNSDSEASSDEDGSAERPRKRRRSSSRSGDRFARQSASSSRSSSRSRSQSKPSERQSSRPRSTLRRGAAPDCRHNSSRHHKHKHKGQSKAKSKGRSRLRRSRDKSKRSRSPKAEEDRGKSHKHGKRAKHMVRDRSKHRHRDASRSSRSCSGSDDKRIEHQGRSSAASVATQPATQPTIAATAQENTPLAGLPVLDSEQLRQRLRNMLGMIR